MQNNLYISLLNFTSLFLTLATGVLIIASMGYSYFWVSTLFQTFDTTLADQKIFFCLALGCFFLSFIIFIVGSPFGEWFYRFYFNMRKPTLREAERINALIEEIEKNYFSEYNEKLNIKYFIVDAHFLNGFAFGFSTIAIHRGALDELKDEELLALIAHEIGHIHYRDGGYRLLAIASSVARKPIDIFIDDLGFLGQFSGIFGLLTLIFLWPLYLTLLFSFIPMALRNKVDNLIDWPKEYRADAFAAKLGYADGVISFFEKLQPLDERSRHGFMSRYGYSHPPTAMRIDRVERLIAE